MPIIRLEKTTKKQIEYIEQLAIDLNLNIRRRNVYIRSIIYREIKFLDELSKIEASKVITRFKEWKEYKKDVSEDYIDH